ncbi:hypothetical protein ACRRTK_015607 [Alexandromys fortis]
MGVSVIAEGTRVTKGPKMDGFPIHFNCSATRTQRQQCAESLVLHRNISDICCLPLRNPLYSSTEEDAGKYCPFEVEKAKLGEAVAEVSAAAISVNASVSEIKHRSFPLLACVLVTSTVTATLHSWDTQGIGRAPRQTAKHAEPYPVPLTPLNHKGKRTAIAYGVSAISAHSTQEETEGAGRPHIGFENGSKEIQSGTSEHLINDVPPPGMKFDKKGDTKFKRENKP